MNGTIVYNDCVNLGAMGFKRRLETEAGQNLFSGTMVAGHHARNPQFFRSIHPDAPVPDLGKVRLVKSRGGFKDDNALQGFR